MVVCLTTKPTIIIKICQKGKQKILVLENFVIYYHNSKVTFITLHHLYLYKPCCFLDSKFNEILLNFHRSLHLLKKRENFFII